MADLGSPLSVPDMTMEGVTMDRDGALYVVNENGGTAVSSNEAGSGQWQVTGALTMNLMASRNGKGNGRVYTIRVACSDAAGNRASGSTTIIVPHDQGN